MRIALFSPLPPSRSGIADYTQALLVPLGTLAAVDTFVEKPADFDASRYDAILYQLGNNPYHTFAYEVALEHPGIIVLHEANLHHLIADLTIRRGDWDAYLREVEFDGGPEALAYAKRYVQPVRRGPNYELPLLKRILNCSKAVIVHSDAVADVVRASGFTGPVAKIPHGAWTAEVDGASPRERLGVPSSDPLFGIFGFLKPYKRIAECLRAFRRLIAEHPEARLILVGEAHAELPLAQMITTLGLSAHVRHIDYAPIEDFTGCLAACDAILNLRHPTVGESSGTLLRALGLGKPTLVSEIGSFREFPDDVCLKVPIDASEEEHIYHYLRLLIERPEIGRELGCRARSWVQRECNWPLVAERYAAFAREVASGTAQAVPPLPAPPPPPVEVPAEYILSWTPAPEAKAYVKTHETRLSKTLAVTPPGGPEDRILEMGAYLQITPALHTKLGYGEVRGCYFGPPGRIDQRTVVSEDGQEFHCAIDHFDAEKDIFPYDDGSFATVLCCELIEHLPSDPMHMMSEINRILKPGGHLVITTPNITSLRAVAGLLQGFHPMLFPAYIKPDPGGDPDPRHAREYTALEMKQLFEDSGFEVTLLETGPFLDEPRADLGWVEHLLEQYMLTQEYRGDGIYIVGRKTKPVRERYPAWLYQ
jgi:glycosyltransferase involved in cell wall biosynthesis/SAM-dependent methyltransferase